MISAADIKTAANTNILISTDMSDALNLWVRMYKNKPDWADERTIKSLNLPSAIASEISRLITMEMESQISGSDRAEYINNIYQTVIKEVRKYCEYACAKGGIIFKPCFNGKYLSVESVQAENFYPTQTDSFGNIIGGIFTEVKKIHNYYYTRLEQHIFNSDNSITITNRAFKSAGNSSLGYETALNEIWDTLLPTVTINNVNRPLFAYFKIPQANSIDTNSPLGVSIYSRAVNLIEQADRQYSRLLWEFEGTELAIDADISMFKRRPDGTPVLPKGKERLFRSLDAGDNKSFYNVFSPAIREQSIINGLNRIFMLIEDSTGISRGTFSDPESVIRTATELKILKQRSYSTIRDIQKALESALSQLADILNIYCDLYSLASIGNYKISFKWDDSMITDGDSEYKRRFELTNANILSKSELRAWFTGETIEEAHSKLPRR